MKAYKSQLIFRVAESLFVSLFAISMFILISAIVLPKRGGSSGGWENWEDTSAVTLMTAVIVSLITGAGTVSTMILGWRNDKRTERETELRIRKLELELENMKLQQGEMRDPLNPPPNNSFNPTASQPVSRR